MRGVTDVLIWIRVQMVRVFGSLAVFAAGVWLVLASGSCDERGTCAVTLPVPAAVLGRPAFPSSDRKFHLWNLVTDLDRSCGLCVWDPGRILRVNIRAVCWLRAGRRVAAYGVRLTDFAVFGCGVRQVQ